MFKLRCVPLLAAVCLIASVAFAQDVPEPPDPAAFDPAALESIDPLDFPVLPVLTDTARDIFERGQAREVPRNPHMFSKVGDSMTASVHFLNALGEGDYDLGAYDDLQAAVDFFAQSSAFDRENYANALGFSTAAALDSTWADRDACEPNETPLDCEFRSANPAFALIMFGTNDVMAFDAALFDYFLRLVVIDTMVAEVVPVLYTFPIRPEEPELSVTFNQIILDIAADYDLPVINLVVALEHLPNYGVDLEDTLHLTAPEPPLNAATFTDAGLEAGYTVRNLVTLQALDTLVSELDLYSSEESS